MACRAGLSAPFSALRSLPVYQSALRDAARPGATPHGGHCHGAGGGCGASGARPEGPRLAHQLVSQVKNTCEAPSSSLATQVLNTVTGQPARGLALHLSRLEDPGLQWMELMKSSTNVDGHCPLFLAPEQVKAGTYRLHFDTGPYWQQLGYTSFYPYVEVVFTVTEQTRKRHIPLLISPFSYTISKGS
uniref:hydroxyisourate hydrolase n=1 Tax=Chelydra serpentina TaxID=8475 RepID=A0A8C3SS76_CHESE